MTESSSSSNEGSPYGERHVHGRVPTSEAWIPVRDLNNDGAELASRGELDEADRKLREALARTEGRDEVDARDLRTRALLNLSSVHDFRAELNEALQLIDESLRICAELVDDVGDERGTRTVIVNAMVARTQILAQSDRMDEALSQADEALAMLNAHDIGQADLMRFQVLNVRSSLLLFMGRLQDSEADARSTLDLAARVDPTLAAHSYLTLGAIAQQTGDLAGSHEFIELANAVQASDGDVVTRQITMENRARAAMQQERWDESSELFKQAAILAKEGGLVTRLTASRMGYAAVYLQTGNPVLAAKVLRQLIDELGTDGAVHDRREAYSFLGDAESKRAKFVLADEAYRAARELSRSSYERCRVDLRRAEMQAEWASFTPLPKKRTSRLREGLEMAIPVLLATEALRGGFAPGPIRERWSLEVAAPARELAFRLATLLSDGEVLVALIENAAASATLQAEAAEAQLHSVGHIAPVIDLFGADLPEDDFNDVESGAELPAAAAGFVGDMVSSVPVRFAPPPRVVAVPGAEPALEKWIQIAEAEYGVTVRSDVVVAAW